MVRHEELEEEYIDAYFALLMEEIGLEEGKRLERENEELRQDPNAAVPEELNQRCLRTIKQYFAAQRQHGILQTIKKVGYRVAILFVAAGTLFSTAFAFSESFRMMVLTFEDHISVSLEEFYTEERTNTFRNVEAKWLPDGYYLTEQERSNYRIWNKYTAETGRPIEVSVYMNTDITMGLDSEDADVEQLEIQGNPALMLAKSGNAQIAWLDLTTGSLWEVFGEDIPQSDAIHVAENVILK